MSWWPTQAPSRKPDAIILPTGHRVRLDVEVTPGRPADAPIFAQIHAAAFARPWSEQTFDHFLEDPSHLGLLAFAPATDDDNSPLQPVGFILARSIAHEAEILSVAVARAARQRGIGSALLYRACERLRAARVKELFLEVGVNNEAGLALYKAHQFVEVGSRPGYYAASEPEANRSDAVILRLTL